MNKITTGIVVVVVSTVIIAILAGIWRNVSKILETSIAVPSGVVVAFDQAFDPTEGCPEGWSNFADAQSRVIIGAAFSDENALELTDYDYRDSGGEETVTLIENQMPSHSHSVGDLEWGHTVDGNGNPFRLNANDGQPFNGITGRLTAAPTGGDEAHENRPPYLALYFCKKD